jgi:anti-sigma factor ChrR (cupin superfamily)
MRHIRKDIIERYSLGGLNESAIERVEIHLLVCETCRASLDNFEAFLSMIKSAAPKTMSANSQ